MRPGGPRAQAAVRHREGAGSGAPQASVALPRPASLAGKVPAGPRFLTWDMEVSQEQRAFWEPVGGVSGNPTALPPLSGVGAPQDGVALSPALAAALPSRPLPLTQPSSGPTCKVGCH